MISGAIGILLIVIVALLLIMALLIGSVIGVIWLEHWFPRLHFPEWHKRHVVPYCAYFMGRLIPIGLLLAVAWAVLKVVGL